MAPSVQLPAQRPDCWLLRPYPAILLLLLLPVPAGSFFPILEQVLVLRKHFYDWCVFRKVCVSRLANQELLSI